MATHSNILSWRIPMDRRDRTDMIEQLSTAQHKADIKLYIESESVRIFKRLSVFIKIFLLT